MWLNIIMTGQDMCRSVISQGLRPVKRTAIHCYPPAPRIRGKGTLATAESGCVSRRGIFASIILRLSAPPFAVFRRTKLPGAVFRHEYEVVHRPLDVGSMASSVV